MTKFAANAVRNAATIAARDGREMWRDGRFRSAAALLFTILGVSLLTGWYHTNTNTHLRDQAQQIERDLSLEKGDMNPHAAAHYGAFVFRPVEALAAIDPGIDPFVGVSVFLEAHQQQLARHRPAEDATPIRRLGELSAAMSLQVLVPLMIVVLTHTAFAGEREQGTLRQVAALGIGRWTLAWGKGVGAAMPLLAVLLPVTVLGVVVMVLELSLRRDGDGWGRAVLLCVCYLTYFMLWLCLGLAVSARARSSRSALVVLLALWFAGVFIAPPLASAAMGRLAPAPTSAQMAASIEDAKARLLRWDQRVDRVEERFLAGELPDGAGVPSNPEVIALVDAETNETALYDEHFDRLFEAYDRQATWYRRLGVLSPSLAIQQLSMALSGTDYDHYREFVNATNRYRREFIQTLNAELSAYEGVNVFDYTKGRDLWARIPAFLYTPPRLDDGLVRQRGSAIALVGWLMVAVAGLWRTVATMRID